ncbi:hypothetical protein [Streptomyces sp. NPDC057686]|uniref:hypothetical protein n=1 Tax=Streptomyces sp. NPDC057686 TaxID=3346212 RepID=UPI0036966392
MTRTTPPRPLDIEALFPELAGHRGTTTRLHPRPGARDLSQSSVGGPMLWPADEPWPVCGEAHGRGRGRRIEDIRRERRIWAAARARQPYEGLTDDERQLMALPAGPEGCDLLQLFWCPFDAHGPTRYGMLLHLRWRNSAQVGEVLAEPPQPPVVGCEGYVPEPCVLHPEQVVTYPSAGLLPEELCARIDAWEEALGEAAEEDDENEAGAAELPGYQYDLSIPPGWRVGGYASWHRTDRTPPRWTAAPARRRCTSC